MVTQRTYKEWSILWSLCHNPKQVRSHKVVMEWAKWAEDMLGPDNCLGFLIKDKQPHLINLFMSDGGNLFVPFLDSATIYSWDCAAVKITNRRSLEAIRVDRRGVAQDSTGLIIGYFTKEDLQKRGLYDKAKSEVPKM